MKRNELNWTQMRWNETKWMNDWIHDMKWNEMKRNETNWKEMKINEITWHDMTWNDWVTAWTVEWMKWLARLIEYLHLRIHMLPGSFTPQLLGDGVDMMIWLIDMMANSWPSVTAPHTRQRSAAHCLTDPGPPATASPPHRPTDPASRPSSPPAHRPHRQRPPPAKKKYLLVKTTLKVLIDRYRYLSCWSFLHQLS